MTETCCSDSSKGMTERVLDQTEAIDARYGAAAQAKESCLCTPVAFNKKLLEVIPSNVVERDYGCGDPTRWVKENDFVLDLGSGSGKNAFICSQIVGKQGAVIGVERNDEMLKLARESAPIVGEKIGFINVRFLKGSIEELDKQQANGALLISNQSIDVILSNCVLNLVNPSKRNELLINIRRVLRPHGRIAISDIVSNKPVPISLQKDPDLWSGCISGAWEEKEFLKDFRSLGFENVHYVDRSKDPWKVIEGIEFRSVTLRGELR